LIQFIQSKRALLKSATLALLSMPAFQVAGVTLSGTPASLLKRVRGAGWRQQIGETDRPSWEYRLYAGDNHRIAAGVQQMPGAIGYMQASFAAQFDLTTIQLPNAADQFISINQATNGKETWPLSIDVHALLTVDPSKRTRSRDVTAFFREAFTNAESITRRESFLPLTSVQLATVYQLWKDHDLEI